MSVNLHLLQASGRLKPFEDTIREAADNVISDVEQVIDLPNVDIITADIPQHAIDATGVGAFVATKHFMRVSIDPKHENVQEDLASELKSSIAHELNHCSRWHSAGRADTLLQALIEEGLAVHFSMQITGSDLKPWCTAVQGKRLEQLKEKAREEFDNEDYDHQAWFFGSEERGIPKWAGYSISYSLVGDYLNQTEKSAAELTDQPTDVFIDQ
jgi:uncharacterized protein YjaZ